MTIHSEFLEILATATKQAGSVRKLADATGLESSTLARWKSKARIPSLDSVQPIFDFLACGWQEALLIGKEGKRKGEGQKTDTLRKQQITDLEIENAKLREQLTLAQGEIQALERQLARLTPTPAHLPEKTSPDSAAESLGGSVRAG